MSQHRPPIAPRRTRRIDGSFAFIPHRFLRDGFLQSLTSNELRLYLMLVLAADRDGISFYSHRRICTVVELSTDAYQQARESLLRKDLIAAEGVRVQVLSLPEEPVVVEPRPLPRRDQVAACEAILARLATGERK